MFVLEKHSMHLKTEKQTKLARMQIAQAEAKVKEFSYKITFQINGIGFCLKIQLKTNQLHFVRQYHNWGKLRFGLS